MIVDLLTIDADMSVGVTVVVLGAATADGKVRLAAGVTKDAVDRVRAGDLGGVAPAVLDLWRAPAPPTPTPTPTPTPATPTSPRVSTAGSRR